MRGYYYILYTLLAVGISACSNNSSTSSSAISCQASGTLASGTSVVANSTIPVTGLTVNIGNDTTGPFSISISGLTTVSTSSNYYSFSSQEMLTVDSNEQVSNTVTVTDMSTNASTTCGISVAGNTLSTTSSSIVVTTSPSQTVTPGTTVYLTASGGGASSYQFQLATTQTGVTLTSMSATEASVTSSVATTVNVIVTAVGGTGGSVTYTVNFTGTTTTTTASAGTFLINVSATSVPVNTIVTMSASVVGINSPVYYFYYLSNNQWISFPSVSNGYAEFYSPVSGTVTILIEAVDGVSGQQYETTVPIQFN